MLRVVCCRDSRNPNPAGRLQRALRIIIARGVSCPGDEDEDEDPKSWETVTTARGQDGGTCQDGLPFCSRATLIDDQASRRHFLSVLAASPVLIQNARNQSHFPIRLQLVQVRPVCGQSQRPIGRVNGQP